MGIKIKGSNIEFKDFNQKDIMEVVGKLVITCATMQGEIDMLKRMLHSNGVINEEQLKVAYEKFMENEEVREEYAKSVLHVK